MVTMITGATDGIGLALARAYQQKGDRLVLVGRRSFESLGDVFDSDNYCRMDLSEYSEISNISSFLQTHRITEIDRLILNAGTGFFGRTADQPAENIRNTVAVNIRSSVALIHRCWPFLRAARGRVVLIGSVIAALPCPDYAVYAATKASVDGLARSLRYELAPDVSVQVIHPGATRTGLHAKIGVDSEIIDWHRFPDAEVVAGLIVSRVEHSGWRQILSFQDRALWCAGSRLARLTDFLIRRR